ncbi:MAG: helix-turn-helix transcriptional regulator, partial [Anaerolineae bacterium]|nr:helix-turn-helix transcriptional regulator [Anaerolineae bacterium]
MQEIQLVILGLLADRELYGYQIVRSFARGNYPWSPAPQSVVEDALAALMARGLVARSHRQALDLEPSRILYAATEKGLAALREALVEAWEDVDAGTSGLTLTVALSSGLPTRDLEWILQRRAQRLAELREKAAQLRDDWLASEDVHPGKSRLLHRLVARLEDDIVWTRDLVAAVQQGGAQATLPIGHQRAASTTVGEAAGAFTFVLHSHLPYCRMAGRWPHGEEWLHEAAAETYVPLLDVLYDLRDEGVPFRLTLSLTPVLTEQLADPLVREHFVAYLDEKIQVAESDIPRFGEQGEKHLEYLAGFYRKYYEHVRQAFVERFQDD